MFSFGEITLIVLIALFILGPERLPVVARSMGRYWRKFHKFLDTAKAELNQMIDLEDEDDKDEHNHKEKQKNHVIHDDAPLSLDHSSQVDKDTNKGSEKKDEKIEETSQSTEDQVAENMSKSNATK